MSFVYDLLGAHTPKKRFYVQAVFFVLSIYCLIDELLHGGNMVIWFGITSALSAWVTVDEYYNMKYDCGEFKI